MLLFSLQHMTKGFLQKDGYIIFNIFIKTVLCIVF